MVLHYFTTHSTVAQLKDCTVQIGNDDVKLIWYDQNVESRYSLSDISVIMTRWFILLRMGQGKHRKHRLILQDCFEQKRQYAMFRRQLIEITNAS
jgi:hypothetical protein